MTLQDLDDAGKDVRAWCFACARGERVDSNVWRHFVERHWPMGLDAAARQFRCRECGSSAHVALYPATRPYYPPMTATDFAAAIYFGSREAAKARKADSTAERAAQRLAEAYARRKAAKPKTTPRPPADLRLVWSKPDA